MKSLKHILFLFIAALLLSDCERDDICSEFTPTTPRLLIEFYDIANQEELKFAPQLSVYGNDPAFNPPTNEDNSSAILREPFETSRIFNVSVNEVKPPLIVGTEGETITTSYAFERRTDLRLDNDDETNSNVDIVNFTYVSEYVYVSRACGYKSIFTTLCVEIVDDGDNWLLGFRFPDNNTTDNIIVENEDATHIDFLH